ncbi:ankyrin repeat protein [Filimonas zeae]|nr:ankyrin repeat domain-containing protein [Filimonas zeae]MDR6340599.1 ankyrin repeat protein [Filimonas zeae]
MLRVLKNAAHHRNAKNLWNTIVYNATSEVQALLEAGANPNMQDEMGNPIVFYVLYHPGGQQLPILQLLLTHGANPNVRETYEGSTPIFHARGEALRMLIEYGADTDVKSDYGETCLHGVREVEDLRYLLSLGLDMHQKGIRKHSLLHSVILQPLPLVSYCIQLGLNVNAASTSGETPLMLLAQSGLFSRAGVLEDCMNKIQLLLDAGADMQMKDLYGNTAADHAQTAGNHALADWINAQVTP